MSIAILVAGVDPHRPPSGSVDFDELEIAYRNESLAISSNGGSLVDWPGDSEQDPTKLIDGWCHGKGRMWHSVENPAEPQEFTFSFESTVTIDTVQIHQNPEWPGRDVEVLVSEDGSAYHSILTQLLPETGSPNANFAFAVNHGLAAGANHLKVRLTSGYQSRHWGLGEIEVFGSGATLRPDDDLYHVNADVYGLEASVTLPLPPGCGQRAGCLLRQGSGIDLAGYRSAVRANRGGEPDQDVGRQGRRKSQSSGFA